MNIYYFGVFLVIFPFSFSPKSLYFCVMVFLLYFLKFIHIYMTFIHIYIEYIFPNTLLFCFLYCIQIYYSSKKKVLPNIYIIRTYIFATRVRPFSCSTASWVKENAWEASKQTDWNFCWIQIHNWQTDWYICRNNSAIDAEKQSNAR